MEKSRVLLGALLRVSDEIIGATKSNNVDSTTRAKALIISSQLDIVASYIILCESEYGAPYVSKALLMRPLIESRANWNHIGSDSIRAKKYLDYSNEIAKSVGEHIEQSNGKLQNLSQPKLWSSSTIEQRVKKLDIVLYHMYDYLSNFVHCNNVADHIIDEKTLNTFSEAMDSAFVGLLAQTLADVGLSFELSDEQHKILLVALGKIKP